jgi:hypothetical protein
MFSTRTIIGIVVGSAIITIGLYSLITSLGVQTINVNDTYAIGESTTYQFSAPRGSKHFINMTADSFHVNLKSPEGGLQIKEKDFKNELSIEWVHLIDGKSTMKIQNTGDSELKVWGYITALLDPIQMTYHILVIISGVIIIGFSAGFSVRKPRGF